ncbi:MAG: hypothetical protein WAT66_06765 [Actinomycetota bacterium]
MRLATILLTLGLLGCGGSAPPRDSGIEGLVTIGPSCPVETPGADCADKPYAADLIVVERSSSDRVRLRSEAGGAFRVYLAPGNYRILSAANGGPPSLEFVDVVVRVHRFTRVTVRFDSGIR